MEEKIQIAPIKLSDVERMVASIKKNVGNEDVDLSLEFILTAFFPTCWNNVQAALNKQYTLGYIAGQRDATGPLEDNGEYYCD